VVAEKNGAEEAPSHPARLFPLVQAGAQESLARSLFRDKIWTRHAIAPRIGVSHTLFRELRRNQPKKSIERGILI